MEIFRELNKKGYKHYYDGTIEELDTMDKNNPDLHSEIMQVVMWLYEKHGFWLWVAGYKRKNNRTYFDFYFSIAKLNDRGGNLFNSPTEAYEAAIEYVLNNLI